MPEEIRSYPPEERKEREMAETLEKERGIFYYQEVDPETEGTKNYLNILGVKVETYASREDVEAIKEELILSETDQDLLRTIAESYKLREPLMFEGDPGVGKTFLMKKFVQLIHGKEAPILELVGTPRTSELEVLGHWAPKGLNEEEDKEYLTTLKELLQTGPLKNLSEELNQRLSELNEKFLKKRIGQEEFQEEFGKITTQHIDTLLSQMTEATVLTKFIKPDTEWEFKEGALLQAYSGREGRGYILIVDEFNLIPSNYQQIFLQIGGEKGALSDSISFWGNTGKIRYPRGQDTWICFASNFPEKTPGRSEVVAPMTDRLVWEITTTEQAKRKKEILIGTGGGRLSNRQKELTKLKPEIVSPQVERGLEWDKVLDQQLGEQIADVVALLDREFVKYYEEVGDTLTIKGEERRRIQQFEFSSRNPLRLFSYLDHFQVRNPETGMIDFSKTLENAFRRYYLNRLASSEAREKMEALFEEITNGDTGKIEFEEEILTRKEIFNILVERASLAKEELEEQIEREVRQAKFNAQDYIEGLVNKPYIAQNQELSKLAQEARRLFEKGDTEGAYQMLVELKALSQQKT
jgi:MoxR-like ATPase